MQRPVCTRRGGHLEFARRLRRPWQVSGPGTLRPSETNRRSALRVPEGTGVETWEHPINPARLSGNRPMATFITLVHGTWARRAKWIQPDSALARYLSDNVAGPVHVTTPPFTWSGSNRLSARLKAAENLRRHLLDQVRDHPNDAHYVIGHSHGGSVAAYAIQDCEDLRVRVRLICLSTPFLQLELNALSGSTRRKLSTLQLFLFLSYWWQSPLSPAIYRGSGPSPWPPASPALPYSGQPEPVRCFAGRIGWPN